MPVRAVLDEIPLMPSLDEFAEVDTAIQEAGSGFVEMFDRLGVRGEVTQSGELYLHVAEPAR